jgi:biofilm PGA synthesis protein PgaA
MIGNFAKVLLLLFATGMPVAMAAELGAPPGLHDRAVELARAGELDESLRILGLLREDSPDDSQLMYDQTVVFSWAGHDTDVLQNATFIDPETAPDYVLGPVAKAWRNSNDFEAAEYWYSQLLARDVSNEDARIGLAMTLADARRPDEALRIVAGAPLDEQGTVPLILTEAYVYRLQNQFMEALASYQHALEIEPLNHSALRGKALALRMALLPQDALTLASEHPGILSDDELVRLKGDVVAVQIRQGTQSSYPVSRRFEGTDRALSRINSFLVQPDLDPAVRLRLQYDRITALSDRQRMADAISDFESLQADPKDAPGYVLSSVGGAYLHEREPELARDYLELAVAREPDNMNYRFRLFYAYADLQDHERSLQLAENLMAELPVTNQIPGSPVVTGSDAHLRAATMVGLAYAYGDQLADSQEHFEQLLAKIPHNTDIRQELANVYRWRGWIDRSLSEYAQVLAVEPEFLSARVGNTHTQLDNRDYAPVEKELVALNAQHWQEPAVIDLNDRWLLRNQQELELNASFGESSGATFGEDQYEVDAVWFSKPFAQRYRATVQTHDAFAEFPEGDERRRRIEAGVEYGFRRWLVNTRLSADRDGGELGFRGSLDYRFNDVLDLGAVFEINSDATPLRGERVGVTGDLAGVKARYAKNESTAVQTALTYLDLSDGNSATSIFLGAEQRLINRPIYKMTLVGELFMEDRARDDVAYFSPLNSVSWTAGLRNDWTMYRRYDFALSHGLTGRAGQYNQSGFSTSTIWSVGYQFRAEINKRWETHVGFSRNSNVYDGAREYANFVVAGFRGRF